MYESGVNEEVLNYNLLFCHACLSSNRTLHSVGDYLDIYLKICDNSRMNLTSQVNVCWECMALLKKVLAFKRKVENAQMILDYCVKKQVPLEDSLSDLTLSNTETTTFECYPISEDENVDEYENYLQKPDKIPEDMDKSVRSEDFGKDELMFKIEDVRGRCDILYVKPMLDLSTSSCDATLKTAPGESPTEEERRHHRWQRSVLLVYKRICSHRYAHHFLRPVSDELAPLYSRIVRRPTDLSTIRQRIKDGVIRTTAELTRALLLMFSNALMYNSSDHKIYQMALEFREETVRELSLLQAAHVERDSSCPLAAGLRRRPAPSPPEFPQALVRRRASVWDASHLASVEPVRRNASAAAKVPQDSVRRRKSVWDAPNEASVEPVRRSSRSAPAAAKVPQDSVRRRKSVWDASNEASVEPVRRNASAAAKVPRDSVRRRKSVWDASNEASVEPVRRSSRSAPAAAKVPQDSVRRRKSVWDASNEASVEPVRRSSRSAPAAAKVPQDSVRRRKSVWDASNEDVKAAVTPRPPRRASLCPEPPAKPSRRRRWDWPCLDNDQYLVANCFKKCKSTVLL